MDEDEEVIFGNSPLSQHLKDVGVDHDAIQQHEEAPSSEQVQDETLLGRSTRQYGMDCAWPEVTSSSFLLEIETAQQILESSLLVSEDEDFISNFLLSEDAMERYSAELSDSDKGRSVLPEVLLFGGSLAAVAGTVFFLSERTHLAATAASVLPSALAAFSAGYSFNTKCKSDEKSKHFHNMIAQLLTDMKTFKTIVRKTMNLLQGKSL